MIEMNPYYARESRVGPVFDVATFSRRKATSIGLTGLVLASLIGAAALYVWNPALLIPHPPRAFAEAQQDVVNLWRDYPRGTLVGVAGAGLIAVLLAAMGLAQLYQSLTGEMYLRVGEAGISLRVPHGFRTLELDLPWEEVTKLTVTQEKQLGSLSRNTGNLNANLTLRTRSHGNVFISLDDFREPAYLVHERLREAMDTRPAELVESC